MAARHAVTHHHTFGHLSSEMGRLSGEMAGIKAHVARIPKEQIYTDEAGNLVREDAVTGSKVTYVKVS